MTTTPGTDRPDAPAFAAGERGFEVHGMTCGSCAARVQRVLRRQEGVAAADVNFATGMALVRLDDATVSDDVLAAAVDRIGYRLAPVRVDEPRTSRAEEEQAAQRMWLRRIVVAWPVAAVFVLGMVAVPLSERAMVFMESSAGRVAALVLAVPVQFWVGWPFIAEAARRARRGTANMDTLIALGTLAAFGFSVVQLFAGGPLYFESAVLIIAFLVLARSARTSSGRSATTPWRSHSPHSACCRRSWRARRWRSPASAWSPTHCGCGTSAGEPHFDVRSQGPRTHRHEERSCRAAAAAVETSAMSAGELSRPGRDHRRRKAQPGT